jgi:hypothetical protein
LQNDFSVTPCIVFLFRFNQFFGYVIHRFFVRGLFWFTSSIAFLFADCFGFHPASSPPSLSSFVGSGGGIGRATHPASSLGFAGGAFGCGKLGHCFMEDEPLFMVLKLFAELPADF